MTRKTTVATRKPAALPAGYAGIHGGIVELLDAARQAAARSVNALMTASYWEIGRRIVEAEQKGRRRAGYGEQLMERLSTDLTARFGRGFSPDNLENMRRFFVAYLFEAISETLSRKSGEGLPIENSETVSRKFGLSELAQVFTLPWSAYEFTSPTLVKEYLRNKLAGFEHEVFAVLFLDTRHRLIEYREMFHGTIDSVSVYPREVVKEALRLNAGAVILSHNHPSGNPEPSQADKVLTQRLKEALGLVEVRTLDHVIVAGADTVSFAERGQMGTSKNPRTPDRHCPSQRDNHPMSKPQARSAIKFDLFAEAARKHKIERLGDPLQVIARHIDFAHLTQVIDGLLPRGDASKGGRPPYPSEVMVRILILKYLYNLSDEQMEYQLLDRMSYQRFCLLTDSANIPDRNTIWHYQQRLGIDGVTALFQAVDNQLLQHGYMARCGQIIDATLVPAPTQHFTKQDKAQLEQGKIPADWSAAKRRQKDLDATHTKKHGKGYHGYKLSISVDAKHKFIRKITTGTASEHDSTHFDEVLHEHNTSADVYADRGYPSAQRSEMLKALGHREHIQRKAKPGGPLSECQKGRNKRIVKTRARVEHPFAQMRHMGGKFIRTIGQARATVTMTMMAACYNLKRLAKFLDDGVDAFYKNRLPKTVVRLQGANA